MGTGLGTGLLVSKRNREHEVLAIEMGHTFINRLGMKHPEYEQETKIVDYISNKL
jgi:glucokinase